MNNQQRHWTILIDGVPLHLHCQKHVLVKAQVAENRHDPVETRFWRANGRSDRLPLKLALLELRYRSALSNTKTHRPLRSSIRTSKSLICALCLAIDHEFFIAPQNKILSHLFSGYTKDSFTYIKYIHIIYLYIFLFFFLFHVFNLYFINSTWGYRREKIFAEHAEMLKYILTGFPCEVHLYTGTRADCIHAQRVIFVCIQVQTAYIAQNLFVYGD